MLFIHLVYPFLPSIHSFLILNYSKRREVLRNNSLSSQFFHFPHTTPFIFPRIPFFLNIIQTYFCQQNNYPSFQIPKQQLHHHTPLHLFPLKGSTLKCNFLLPSIKHFLLLVQNNSVTKAKPK